MKYKNKLADSLLRSKGITVVYKVARSGATTSLIKRSLETGKKVVIIEPTKRILRQPIEKEIPKKNRSSAEDCMHITESRTMR